MKSEEGGSGGFIVGFLVGGIMGAAVALVLSPRSGEETRDVLGERSIELKVKAEDIASRARGEADDLVSRGKSVIEEQKIRVQEAIEEGKGAAAQKKAELMARYKIAKEKGEVPFDEESGTTPE